MLIGSSPGINSVLVVFIFIVRSKVELHCICVIMLLKLM